MTATTSLGTAAPTAESTRAGNALGATPTNLIPAQKYAVMVSSWAEPSATTATLRMETAAIQAATSSPAGGANLQLPEAATSASPSAKMGSKLDGKNAMMVDSQPRAMVTGAAALAKLSQGSLAMDTHQDADLCAEIRLQSKENSVTMATLSAVMGKNHY